jgi:carbamate kinase
VVAKAEAVNGDETVQQTMRVVIALGGNALLRRQQALTADNQRRNVQTAVRAMAPLAEEHQLVITHGNGPQVGLLALQTAATGDEQAYPLDILDAESEGMIGYLIEQELGNLLAGKRRCVTLLTQVEVNATDPAFKHPAKHIGPVYSENEAHRLAREKGWSVAADGMHYRRVVASPRPQSVLELSVIRLLVEQGIVVVCAGGGGIPVVRRQDGSLIGVEAVIDKDFASALLARELRADALLMLTDVDGVYRDWGGAGARAIRSAAPQALRQLEFAAGSMGPKVEAACEFVEQTGTMAAIGRLDDAQAILRGEAGTLITPSVSGLEWW